MTVYAITDTKKRRTGIAPTYLPTTPMEQMHHGKTRGKRFGGNFVIMQFDCVSKL